MGVEAFVTGGGGFAARHLVTQLRRDARTVVAPPRGELDVTDANAVRGALADAQPAVVFHLAAFASVRRSWQEPRKFLLDNLEMTLNVLEAVRLEVPTARVLYASSGEVYGPPDRLPVDENAPLRPQSPYATSKAACDLLAAQYADSHGLQVVRTRAFNHAGPGQPDDYVIGSLTRQVAEAEARGEREVMLRTGNPDSRRDFTDVRDVVRAYVEAAAMGSGAFNVCSGRTASVRELIAMLEMVTPLVVRHEIDPERVRAHDIAEVRGSAERLQTATGWTPEVPLQQTVADALDYWRTRL